jgi:hypothetical protein
MRGSTERLGAIIRFRGVAAEVPKLAWTGLAVDAPNPYFNYLPRTAKQRNAQWLHVKSKCL